MEWHGEEKLRIQKDQRMDQVWVWVSNQTEIALVVDPPICYLGSRQGVHLGRDFFKFLFNESRNQKVPPPAGQSTCKADKWLWRLCYATQTVISSHRNPHCGFPEIPLSNNRLNSKGKGVGARSETGIKLGQELQVPQEGESRGGRHGRSRIGVA